MKWNRQTVKMVVIAFATVAFTAFILKFTIDNDGETIILGGDDPSSQVAADPGQDPGQDPATEDVQSGDNDPEYTVLEPGSTDRGPLRIVTGDGGEYYWTEDHYESFERILRRS